MNKPHEACGVFGIYRKDGRHGVIPEAYHALYALQHRGQESCGIAINTNGVITCHKDEGLVNDVFTRSVLEKLPEGRAAVAHCLYGPKSSQNRDHAQPMLVNHRKGALALCNNGVLTNAAKLREELEDQGAIFHTTSDAEIISYLVAQERLSCQCIEQAVANAMDRMRGSFSMVIMSSAKLVAARDPHGFHPLCMGEIDGDIVFASESCALDAIGATFVRDIQPGEVVVVSKEGVKTLHCQRKCDSSLCVFEFIYFARPDSIVEGSSVHTARVRAGSFLALEHPVQADVVIGVPDSGLDAAIGFARQSGIPYGIGFIKNKYIGRTFIQPTQKERANSVRIKLNAVRSTVEGKRVVLVDDSIVRGTTSAHIVSLLREAGATEVHMRLSSPPFTNMCYFGTDIGSVENLIAAKHSTEEICKIIGVDSLGFLNVNHLPYLADHSACGFCKGCFTGVYPEEIPGEKVNPICSRPLPTDETTEDNAQ
ncbi:MAG: amidophosphoribosyltransferase [bacterium]|nr:amidophosphoribosyltransferase [bacterium]